jgi:hypothetical protein
MSPRRQFVHTPILESWPLVPIEQDANLKYMLEDPDYWRDADPPPPTPRPRRNVAPVIIPGKHGGWRPGAGAPRRNLNALKTGIHAQRLVDSVLLIHNVPDLKALVYECARQTQTKSTPTRYRRALTLAWMASLQDKETAEALRTLLLQGLARAATNLHIATPEMARHAKIPAQNNQTIKRNKEPSPTRKRASKA